ncbi:MAG TPA: twin-arginine translocase TatA/TatE family subunit [Pirellulaceae bacterium]|nr:twin-arginine translocase TatA/TatE family subunit [Pirellulaceae bacterium]HMO92991.1 twin-arginine translocase TatA/TatE family subunit [Pirellulaceae bacterium]HMP67931.1 twin-arginine translocase TatA/TatE family subunit [Pirellulaceae bacterium]
MFGIPGGWELLIVVGLFMLLFGAARLPSMMRNMGRSVNEFKAGLSEKPAARVESSDEKESDPEKVKT